MEQSDLAKEAFKQAKGIAKEINSGNQSEFHKLIVQTAQLLGSYPSNEESIEPSATSADVELTEEQKHQYKTQADMLLEEGDIEEAESIYDVAIEKYQQALELYLSIDDREGVIQSHLNQGVSYRRLGNYDIAQKELNRALQLSQSHSLELLHAHALTELAIISDLQGDHLIAVSLYEKALQLLKDTGNRFREEPVLGALGNVYQKIGNYEQSVSYYNRAIQLAREVGHRRNEGVHLGNLGNIHQKMGEYERAMEHYVSALNISRDISNPRFESINLGNLGNVCKALEDYEQAPIYYTEAIAISRVLKINVIRDSDGESRRSVYQTW